MEMSCRANNCRTNHPVCLQFCHKRVTADLPLCNFRLNIMGGNSEEKHEDKVEKKEKKHEEEGDEKRKEKKGKDKEGKDGEKKEKKPKDPADKKDPTKLRQKLEKLEVKMQALAVKKEEILKLLHEAEQNAAAAPPP